MHWCMSKLFEWIASKCYMFNKLLFIIEITGILTIKMRALVFFFFKLRLFDAEKLVKADTRLNAFCLENRKLQLSRVCLTFVFFKSKKVNN
jgi:hypothetical protein